MKDPYKILGVSPDASPDELKKAYRRLARELHPDSDPGNPWAEDEFKELATAYDLLSDPGRRARHDLGETDVAGRWRGSSRRRPKTARPKARKSRKPDGAGRTKRGKTEGLKIKGADVEYTLRVDFLEAAKGVLKHIDMANGKRLKVAIPAGSEDGRVLRLKGQGLPGFGGAVDGNAHVEVLVDPHPQFRREKNDVHVDVPVTLPEAVLGGAIEVPTIDGMVKLTVPMGSNTGTRLRLRGKGVPGGKKGTGARGDQFVHLRVVLPKKPDKAFIRFVEKWAPDHAYRVRPKSPGKRPAKTGRGR